MCDIGSEIRPDGNPREVLQASVEEDTQFVLSHGVAPTLAAADADKPEPKWAPKTFVCVPPATGRLC